MPCCHFNTIIRPARLARLLPCPAAATVTHGCAASRDISFLPPTPAQCTWPRCGMSWPHPTPTRATPAVDRHGAATGARPPPPCLTASGRTDVSSTRRAYPKEDAPRPPLASAATMLSSCARPGEETAARSCATPTLRRRCVNHAFASAVAAPYGATHGCRARTRRRQPVRHGRGAPGVGTHPAALPALPRPPRRQLRLCGTTRLGGAPVARDTPGPPTPGRPPPDAFSAVPRAAAAAAWPCRRPPRWRSRRRQ